MRRGLGTLALLARLAACVANLALFAALGMTCHIGTPLQRVSVQSPPEKSKRQANVGVLSSPEKLRCFLQP